MAGSVEVTINGQTYAMPVSYRASREIAERVGDPLQMAVAAYRSGALDMTTEQVIDAVTIGARLGGCPLTRDEVAEFVFESGVATYAEPVGAYIAMMVSGGPEKQKAVDEKKA